MRRSICLSFFFTLCACSAATPGSPDASAPKCGNGVAEGAEVCDGLDVRGATCGSLKVGVMRCASSCDAFDTSGCDTPAVDAGAEPDAGIPDAGQPDAGPTMALLVRNGRIEHADGRATDVRGAVSCCGGGYGWPLFDEAWVDLTSSKGVSFLHMRLGPFMTTNMNGETDWAPTGGGYVEVNGKADVTQFNERFWARVRALIEVARAKGQYVEVDVIDGWAVKHCRWGDLPGYSPWDHAFNVQDDDLCASAGSTRVGAGSVFDRWIRKVVQETGRYDNVLYEDGNEVGLVSGYSTEWTASMQAAIRDEEQRLGYARHLFGTNSGSAAAMQHASVDYVELHQNQAPTPAQCAGKPCMVNEYNPDPPLTPQQFKQRYCAARQQGTFFWYWRHGQSDADLRASLDLMQAGCP